MENLVELEGVAVQQEAITLQMLVGRLVAGVVPRAVRNGSFLVNDVPADLKLLIDPELVATVLSNLVTTMATHAQNTCVRISASSSNNVITVQLRDQQNNGNTYTIANCLKSIQPIAEEIEGYLGITSQDKQDTTVIFSFLNL